uniref:Uncharacterized protein n=1 Tax=Arundo donax TaxID=35708 RepID=A0A0A9GU62_ARUDO
MQGLAPSNTHEFRCFQSNQAPMIINELKPFFCSLGTFLTILRHQSANDTSWRPGAHLCNPSGCRILNQNSRAKTQVVRRCWAFSSAWSHSGH